MLPNQRISAEIMWAQQELAGVITTINSMSKQLNDSAEVAKADGQVLRLWEKTLMQHVARKFQLLERIEALKEHRNRTRELNQTEQEDKE